VAASARMFGVGRSSRCRPTRRRSRSTMSAPWAPR
jgi:hypothetical protein